jgi:two-component system, chemotaxis family, protein-glutamate methylesterase/glutaminase
MREHAAVLIVEPSAVARNRLRDALPRELSVKLAQTISIGRARVDELKPLGVVVRIDEGNEDAFELVHSLTRRGVPTLVIFGRSEQRAALPGGASCLCLPTPASEPEWQRYLDHIQTWLTDLLARRSLPPRPASPSHAPGRSSGRLTQPPAQSDRTSSVVGQPRVICIGVSTGGPEALASVFARLPATTPPIVVVQHMPKDFTGALAKRLDDGSRIHVEEASGDDRLEPGHAYIAPGDIHLRLVRQGLRVTTELFEAPPVDRHRPSVNVLFESAARVLGSNAVGVIMTGMGDDGARGLLAMKHAGAATLAQDAPGCTVFGMPQRAIQLGAADYIAPLDALADRILDLAQVPEMLRGA